MHDINLVVWVKTIGYTGIFLILFLQTAFFFTFFLPGDSLMFAAGLLAAQRAFDIELLLPVSIVVVIAGYFIAYLIGERFGTWLLQRPDSFWLRKRYIVNTEKFYTKHGGKAMILGRLIPVIRSFVPVVAGMGRMSLNKFALFNVIGGCIWAGGFTLGGYFLGHYIPNIGVYVLPIILFIIILSITPGIWTVIRRRLSKSK